MKKENLIKKITKYLEDEDGDLNIGISVYYEKNHIVFLLFCRRVLSYYVSLQINNNVCYFDKLDSTGFVDGIAKDFIKAIISTVETKTICCFSHPKPVFVFQTSRKNLLRPFALASFWIEAFHNTSRNIFVWSNFFDSLQRKYNFISKGHPFRTKDELVYFEDDPKSRVKENISECTLERLFTTLLCRNDFVEGCLIYATDKTKENYTPEFDIDEDISITNYLTGLDLSTEKNLIEESEKLINKFNLEISEFKFTKKKKFKLKEKPAIILQTKRRK